MDELIVGQWHPVVLEAKRRMAGRPSYFLTSGTPIFTAAQIERLRSLVDAQNEPAGLEGYGADNTPDVRDTYRRTRVRFVNVLEEPWAYELVWAEALKANQLLQFDIVPFHDTMQLARYDAEEQGFFRWHSDTVPEDTTRKMTIVVPLSNSGDFEGGVLEFNENGAIRQVPQKAGCPVIFPSWLLHRVTPVTAGRRYSLVAWVRGPAWR